MRVHDFPSDARGKAIPYGVYDMARHEAWVSVGRDHDTPAFAVASIRQWWTAMGRRAHPEATSLFITADAGGSNGYRSRAWKRELQTFADETQLRVRVSHFPPRHEQVEQNRASALLPHHRELARDTPHDVRDHRGPHRQHTGTTAALRVTAKLDTRTYPTGVAVTASQMDALALIPDTFHGEWNYELRPR